MNKKKLLESLAIYIISLSAFLFSFLLLNTLFPSMYGIGMIVFSGVLAFSQVMFGYWVFKRIFTDFD